MKYISDIEKPGIKTTRKFTVKVGAATQHELIELPYEHATGAWIVTIVATEEGDENNFRKDVDWGHDAFTFLKNQNVIPTYYRGLMIESVQTELLSTMLCRITVDWATPLARQNKDNWNRNYSVGVKTVNVKTSPTGEQNEQGIVDATGLPAQRLNMGGAIATDEQGVNGIDIEMPAGTYSMSKVFSPMSGVSVKLTSAIRLIARYTACVNKIAFEGFPRGELLIGNGTTISQDTECNTTIQLSFNHMKNFNFKKDFYNIENDPNRPGKKMMVREKRRFEKRGWQAYWEMNFQTMWTMPTGTKIPFVQPIAGFCENVYTERNFNDLIQDLEEM